MNSLKFSKQTKGDDCWVFRGLLIVLMLKQTLKNQGKFLNEKIQGKFLEHFGDELREKSILIRM